MPDACERGENQSDPSWVLGKTLEGLEYHPHAVQDTSRLSATSANTVEPEV